MFFFFFHFQTRNLNYMKLYFKHETYKSSCKPIIECWSWCGNDVLIGCTLLHVKGFLLFQNQDTEERGRGLWASGSFTECLQAERGGTLTLNTNTHTRDNLVYGIITNPASGPLIFKSLSAALLDFYLLSKINKKEELHHIWAALILKYCFDNELCMYDEEVPVTILPEYSFPWFLLLESWEAFAHVWLSSCPQRYCCPASTAKYKRISVCDAGNLSKAMLETITNHLLNANTLKLVNCGCHFFNWRWAQQSVNSPCCCCCCCVYVSILCLKRYLSVQGSWLRVLPHGGLMDKHRVF